MSEPAGAVRESASAARRASAIGRLRLSTHFAALGVVLLAVVLAASFAALSVRMRGVTQSHFEEELRRTQQMLLRLERRELSRMLWTASLVGETPTLRAAIETWRVEDGFGGPRRAAELRATLQRAGDAQLRAIAADLLVLTDGEGKVLAASTRGGGAPRAGVALGDVPAVRRALDPDAPVDTANVGVVQVGDYYYTAAAAPIMLDGYTIGAVLLGTRIDQAYVGSLHESFDGEIVVTARGRPIGSTLTPAATAELPTLVTPATVRALTLDGQDYAGAALPLGSTQSGEPVTLVLLHSATRSVRAATAAFARDFLLFGLAALVVAALGATFGARAVLAPLTRVVGLMQQSARTGIFGHTTTPRAAPREIRSLTDSYAQLIHALESERTAVQRRTDELEMANEDLTQQIRERVRVERALSEREEQLRQSQKLEALGTLAGGVAHDFNNLLTVISGFTQLALTTTPEDAPARADLVQVKDAAHRAGALTAQLLAFGRRQVLQPRVLDLNDAVRQVETMLRHVLGGGVELRTELAARLPRIHADPGQLEQVLMNLAINARDAMPDGGVLTIATEEAPGPDGAGVALVVSDNGTGMDEATRARIFEPFFTTKEVGKGTGLGLATVYGIVQQSGGSITVDSEAGAGTTFRVVLPAVSATPASVHAVREEDAPPRGRETILLVEDDDGVRAFTARVLTAQGYTVLAAASGAEALATADRSSVMIDLLLTDVVMPQMTGREVARRLRLGRPETRVLFMSGHSAEAVSGHGDLASDAAFIRKPFSPDQLLRTVRATLDAEIMHVVR